MPTHKSQYPHTADEPWRYRGARHRYAALRVTLFLVLVVVSSAAARITAAADADQFRVTIVGIDGATWRVLDSLLARGEVPNFARLIANGVRAPLRSRIPMYSAAVWTTMATGVRRERHGITNFHTTDGHLSASLHRRVPALWVIASSSGLRNAVIGWWVTYPAEAVEGVIVSERALKTRDEDLRALDGRPSRGELSRLFHPPDAAEMVGDLLVDLSAVTLDEDERTSVIRTMQVEDSTVVGMLQRLRKGMGPFDLEMMLLRGLDPVSHHFWKFFEPDASAYADSDRPSAEEVRRYGGTIEDHYRHVDGLLGDLEGSGMPDHVVMLLSDHGFEAGHQPFRSGVLSGTHGTKSALHGIFVASGGPIRRGVRIESATILDVAPTVLHLMGLPVAQNLEGRVLADILEPKWAESHPVQRVPAYTIPPVALSLDGRSAGPDSPVDEVLREQLRALGYIE